MRTPIAIGGGDRDDNVIEVVFSLLIVIVIIVAIIAFNFNVIHPPPRLVPLPFVVNDLITATCKA